MTLEEFFARHPRTALGLSGGTDSSYLLYAGLACGAEVRPYYIKTQFQPEFELEDARRMCSQLGAELCIIEADILSVPCVAENPEDCVALGTVKAIQYVNRMTSGVYDIGQFTNTLSDAYEP